MNKSRNNTIPLLLISYLCLLQPSFGAGGQNFRDSGIAKFNAGQYDDAMADLWKADSDSPRDATTHYYLGRALEQVGKPNDAIFHYQKASQYAPPGSEIQKHINEALAAHQGQAIFQPRQPRQPRQANGGMVNMGNFRNTQNSSGQGGAGGGSLGVPGSTSGYAPNSMYAPPTMNGMPAGGYGQPGQGLNSNRAQRDAQRAAKRAARDAAENARRIARGRPPRYSPNSSSTSMPWGSASNPSEAITLRREQADLEIARVNQNSPNAQMEIMHIKERCEIDCDRIRASMTQNTSSSALQQSASSLQAQLQDQKLTGSGIKLVPNGTNLNVRNYETFHSDQDDLNNQIPLVAKPLRLQDVQPSLYKPSQKGTGSAN